MYVFCLLLLIADLHKLGVLHITVDMLIMFRFILMSVVKEVRVLDFQS